MKFHERIFTVYAIFMATGEPRPWASSTGGKLTEASKPLFDFERDRSAVRTLQYVGTAPNMKEIKFGRIPHNAKGAAKWTHDYNGRIASGEAAHFVSAEVWAPAWTMCERDLRAPDVYLSVSNRHSLVPSRFVDPPKFKSVCILAVADDLGPEASDAGRAAAAAFTGILSASLGYKCQQPWGRSSGSGFTDAINDLALTEPFRPPLRSQDNPAADLGLMGWLPLSGLPD